MSENKLKEALSAMLQYGWMWGNPRHISKKQWDTIEEVYKGLNGGKAFEPDRTKKAK